MFKETIGSGEKAVHAPSLWVCCTGNLAQESRLKKCRNLASANVEYTAVDGVVNQIRSHLEIRSVGGDRGFDFFGRALVDVTR